MLKITFLPLNRVIQRKVRMVLNFQVSSDKSRGESGLKVCL